MEESKSCEQSQNFIEQKYTDEDKYQIELEQCESEFGNDKNWVYDRPKKPLTAYMLYHIQTRADVRNENPGF